MLSLMPSSPSTAAESDALVHPHEDARRFRRMQSAEALFAQTTVRIVLLLTVAVLAAGFVIGWHFF